jgi:nitrite reductase (NADH) small subunit
MSSNENWISICELNDLVDNSGVCALVDEQQVALFKLRIAEQDHVMAISNWDPVGQANVLYRGLTACVSQEERGVRYVVASPLYKQRYCLTTGECIDNPELAVSVFPARIVDNTVQLDIAS